MKYIYTALCLLALPILPSCIEEYGFEMEDEYGGILVVEGQIVGGAECEFIIQRTCSDADEYEENGPILVDGAIVHIICSNGQVFGANRVDGARHYVDMGELYPDETYHLRVQVDDEGFYESEPMRPLPSPELRQVSYTLSDDGKTVQVRITNEDPGREMYYMWVYDEHWEVNTPLVTQWEYSPKDDAIVPLTQKINHGWASKKSHTALIGSNLDYGNGALRNHKIYSLPTSDNRFNTRYLTKIHQMAISKEEYEYYKQMEAQSTQTGGIFTLMPSQLPTNIHNTLGHKAVGYIGVHLNYSDAELYINRRDVGHTPRYKPEILTESDIPPNTSMWDLYSRGYCVYRYDRILGRSEWTRPWCVDCREPYWGASLDRPDFWKDN